MLGYACSGGRNRRLCCSRWTKHRGGGDSAWVQWHDKRQGRASTHTCAASSARTAAQRRGALALRGIALTADHAGRGWMSMRRRRQNTRRRRGGQKPCRIANSISVQVRIQETSQQPSVEVEPDFCDGLEEVEAGGGGAHVKKIVVAEQRPQPIPRQKRRDDGEGRRWRDRKGKGIQKSCVCVTCQTSHSHAASSSDMGTMMSTQKAHKM